MKKFHMSTVVFVVGYRHVKTVNISILMPKIDYLDCMNALSCRLKDNVART
jgi:hypothetical protein